MNTQNIKGLILTLTSDLVTSKFKHIVLRGIMVIDLVQMTFDLWGL